MAKDSQPQDAAGGWSDVQAIFDTVPAPIFAKDREGRYRACNRAFAEFLGRAPGELLGLRAGDISPPELAERYQRADDELYARGGTQIYESLVQPPHGPPRLVSFRKTLLAGSGGEVRGLVGIIFDVTDRQDAQEALRQSEAKLSQLFHASPDTIVLTRAADGKLLDVNRGFEEATGYSRAEALASATTTLNLWTDPAERAAMVADLRRSGAVDQRDFGFRRKDGTLRTGNYSARAIKLGEEECVVFVMRDVTEQRRLAAEHARLEEQLRHAQKLEAIGQVAGGVAHDFNNLLTVQLGTLGLLEDLEGVPAEARELLAEVKSAARAAAELTRQLLAFSRRQVLHKRTASLNEVLHGFVRLLRRILPESIALEVRPSADPVWIEGDIGAIEQVLMNLAVNARDAMPRGGRLTLETAAVEVEAGPRAEQEGRTGRFVRLTVRDTGEGIAPEVRKRMFEPFFTTKPQGAGTGLGLATVYGITRQHGGWIEVESQPGAGAEFHVFFPSAAPPLWVAPDAPAVQTGAGRGEVVLLVEDAAPVRKLLAAWLRRLGFAVLEAGDGAAGLALLRTAPRVDLLLTDVVMPGGASGLDLLRAARVEAPGLPAVLTSGYSADLLASGPPADAGFLAKPWTPEALARALREQLDRARKDGGPGTASDLRASNGGA